MTGNNERRVSESILSTVRLNRSRPKKKQKLFSLVMKDDFLIAKCLEAWKLNNYRVVWRYWRRRPWRARSDQIRSPDVAQKLILSDGYDREEKWR